MDLLTAPAFSAEPMKRMRINHPADESIFFEADIKSIKHPKVKPHADAAQNRLTKMVQDTGGRKTPEYVQAFETTTRQIVHLCMDGYWDVQSGGKPLVNTQAARDDLMRLIPGIAEAIKAIAEDDRNFFEKPAPQAKAKPASE